MTRRFSRAVVASLVRLTMLLPISASKLALRSSHDQSGSWTSVASTLGRQNVLKPTSTRSAPKKNQSHFPATNSLASLHQSPAPNPPGLNLRAESQPTPSSPPAAIQFPQTLATRRAVTLLLRCGLGRRAQCPERATKPYARSMRVRAGLLDSGVMSARPKLEDLKTTQEAGESLPSYGPAWDAAIAYGIDVTLLEANLRLTPTERLQQLDDMLATYEALRP